MKYRLTITPAFEASRKYIELAFETAEQMIVSKDSCAALLLFIQDELGLMKPYSNMMVMEEFIDGEWEEYEEFNKPDVKP